MPKLSPELLSVLRCPVTGSPLEQDGDELVTTSADQSGQKLRYRIEDGIPLLLPPELHPAASTIPAEKYEADKYGTDKHDAAPLPASD